MKASVLFTAKNIAVLLFAFACATTQTEGESKSQKKDDSQASAEKFDRIQTKDQEIVQNWLAKRPESSAQAFCLFSSGGWSNRGQHCVMTANNSNSKILYTKGFGGKGYVEKKLSNADYETFRKLNETMQTLKSIRREAYDHLKYEYVVFTKTGSEIKATFRLSIDHPEPDQVSKKYNETTEAFLKKVEDLSAK